MPCKSVPASGSVSPTPVRNSPVANFGRNSFFCSSVPCLLIIQVDKEWLPKIPAIPIHPLDISSNKIDIETISRFCPPYSSGMSIPNKPISFIFFTISSGYVPDFSSSEATGLISLSTNDLIVSLKNC